MNLKKYAAGLAGGVLGLLAYEGVSYIYQKHNELEQRRSEVVEDLSQEGIRCEIGGDTIRIFSEQVVEDDVPPRGFTGDECRALAAAQFLAKPTEEGRKNVALCENMGVEYLCIVSERRGGELRLTLSQDEMKGLCEGNYDSWQGPMRGLLRRFTDIAAEQYPQDERGNLLRGAALDEARRTTDMLYLAPRQLVADSLYEVVSRPSITPQDVADHAFDHEELVAKLTDCLADEDSRGLLAMALLARVDYAFRYEAPDGAAYQIHFPLEMIQQEYGKYLRGEE